VEDREQRVCEGKKRYGSPREAINAACRLEKCPYHCPACGDFHVTSQGLHRISLWRKVYLMMRQQESRL
jgi:hypothetical protein